MHTKRNKLRFNKLVLTILLRLDLGMKIKTKLAIEVIVLVTLISMVSFIALVNTKQVQDSFVGLSSETLPILETLKDMRFASTKIVSTTMEIILIEEESKHATGQQLIELEESLEWKFAEIDNAKFIFNNAYSKYSDSMERNFPEELEHRDTIAEKWNNLIFTSNTMIKMKAAGASGNDILILENEFHNSQLDVNNALDHAISITAANVNEQQEFVESIVGNTTLTILISLNLFIAAALGIRFFILKSISTPLSKLRKTTHEISKGDFIKTNLKGNDEITELSRDIDSMSSELEKLNETIVKNERLTSIGDLASRLAHDLRNPLSVIKNSIEIMNVKLDPIMDEKTSHQMARVGRAVSRMTHQIDDVLDYVNVSDLQLQPHSLSTVLESAALNTNIPSYVKINHPKNSSTVNCDAYKLEIVFSNIMNNAVQALDGDGEITLKVTDRENEALVEIIDSGPGIPESAMPKIFDPLFTTKQVGTGLGLASCRSIIDKHGGTITVSNEPTTFSITLPKNPPIKKPSEFDEIAEDAKLKSAQKAEAKMES